MKKKNDLIFSIIILIIILIIFNVYKYLFRTTDKISRIVTNPNKVTVIEPKNVKDVIAAVKFAKANGMKVSAMGGRT